MKICLVAYDSGMYINYFPLGLAYVASELLMQGHEVEVYSQDVYHYPETHLTSYLDDRRFDVVGVGMCAGYYQYDKLFRIARAVGHRAKLWAGGHMVSASPDYFGEELNKICDTEIFTGMYGDAEYPTWELFPMDYYSLIRLPHSNNSDRCFPMLSGSGCPFRCNFCYRMEEGYRARSIDSIKEEICRLREYHINFIDFADELLMYSVERTHEVCDALKPLGIKWMCNGRLNYAKPRVLKEMKEAGCVSINYGVESVCDEVLKNMNKKLTYKQIISGTEATLGAGISPRLNMLWGNIGDTKETLRDAVDFLLKYDDHAELRTIRPVTPYPGSPLFDYAVEQGMIEDAKDFYENKHKNSDLATVQFTGLKDKDFHIELLKANTKLIDAYYSIKRGWSHWWATQLYQYGNTSFRGFRQT